MPPNKTSGSPGEKAAAEIATSNVTLHQFLGGRQKAWMTGHGQVTPSPRSNSGPLAPPLRDATHQSSSRDQNPPKITEPMVTPRKSSIKPSPLPTTPISTSKDSGKLSLAAVPITIQTNQSSTQPTQTNSIAKEDGHSPKITTPLAVSNAPLPATVMNTPHLPANTNLPTMPRKLAPQPVSAPTSSSPSSQPTSQNNMRTPSSGKKNTQTPNEPTIGPLLPSPPPRPPIGWGMPLIILQSDLEHLRVGQNKPNQFPTVAEVRFMLLNDAVRAGDWFFLALHQVSCMHHLYLVRDHKRSPNFGPEFDVAFQVLALLLLPNNVMDTDHVNEFALFPSTKRLSNAVSEWALLMKAFTEAKGFLQGLPKRLYALREKCMHRQIPPTAREIAEEINVPSVIMQRIIFVDIVNYIFVDAGLKTAYYLGDLFRGNQIDFVQSLAGTVANLSWMNDFQVRLNRESELMIAFQNELAMHRNAVPRPSAVRMAGGRSITNSNDLLPATDRHYWMRITGSLVQNARKELERYCQGPRQHPEVSTPIRLTLEKQNPQVAPTHQITTPNPILRCASRPSDLHSNRGSLYQFVKGFALPPFPSNKLDPPGFHKFEFHISPKDNARIAKLQQISEPPFFMRMVGAGSITYRLRCCQMKIPNMVRNETDLCRYLGSFAVTKTCFPPFHRINLGTNPIYSFQAHRTRDQTGRERDYPIDVTNYVQAGQLNTLVIQTRQMHNQRADFQYTIAVEVLEVAEHDAIIKGLLDTHTKSADDVLLEIKKSLSRNEKGSEKDKKNAGADDDDDDDDDEITLLSDNLVINLTDPWTSQIFKIPVRAYNCVHRECFDLATYLSTRSRKSPDGPSDPDDWLCPICKGAASPLQLIVDGFLVNVRKELEGKGLLATKAIIVEKDGSWRPKEDVPAESRLPKRSRSVAEQDFEHRRKSTKAPRKEEEGSINSNGSGNANSGAQSNGMEREVIILD